MKTVCNLSLVNGDNRVSIHSKNESMGELNKIFTALEDEYEHAYIEVIEGSNVRKIVLK